MKQEFAIVDIETAGGNPGDGGGITEVAIIIHDGKQILSSYQTLINPERLIPGFITGLTGIDNQMVADSPTFEEVAEEIFGILKDRVFIAHNVGFDYTFIQKALEKSNINYKAPKLCTVRMSRKVFPGYKSYSLGRICEHLDIQISARHRAFGDAEATAYLFEKIYQKDAEAVLAMLKKNNGEAFLPPNITKEKFTNLPEKTGIYYFHDVNGKVIYVGKALNIKSRFKGHFSGDTKGKDKLNLKNEIHDVSWELTGNEFLAYLLELHEIKRLWPKYNKSQKFISSTWGIIEYEDNAGFLRFQVSKIKPSQACLRQFESHGEAWKYLLEAVEKYELCPKLCGIQKANEACYDYLTNQCKGACCGQEIPPEYNARVREFLQKTTDEEGTLIIKERGRSADEETALLFEKGMFIGYSFISKEDMVDTPENLLDHIPKIKPFQESKYILRSFLPKLKFKDIFLVKEV
ncbi:GIY-YIG nuclease family protein [Belliella sp. DSM 107340]|uniref:GIY-YIG nuclease family protein n=1 Tax=Belliella calami TaxID=2923436 RepID=A0ABS9UTD8_9BACT|nr:GIY-YIG nuclease family protein [Belliella calami]